MGGPRTKPCAPGQHRDRMLRGGKRVACTVCGDEFPCAHACGHLNCAWVKNGEDSLAAYTNLRTNLLDEDLSGAARDAGLLDPPPADPSTSSTTEPPQATESHDQ